MIPSDNNLPKTPLEEARYIIEHPNFLCHEPKLKRIIAGLAAQINSLLAERGWLVENGGQGEALRYRMIADGMPGWTPNHMEALRFARRQDAEAWCAEDEDAWRVAKHMWCNGVASRLDTAEPFAEPELYARCLDGTGSWHVCAKDDPGAMPFYLKP